MKAYYCDHFVLPLPPGHRFPMDKYALLRERILADGTVAPTDLRVPPPASDRELLRVHTPAYVAAVTRGTLSLHEVRQIGFPWSPELVERSRRSVGGTLAACRSALEDGVAGNLAGGTHHAHPAGGGGFCVFNDAAVAIRALQAEGRIRRAAVVDCDVHQGDGTAAAFAGDPSVFTFSIHGERNYPFRKVAGDLDVALPDGAGDGTYLEALERALARVLAAGRPDLVVYVAGADPFAGDRLGRLSLTAEGLAARDALVLRWAAAAAVPVAVVMGGGYAVPVATTVAIHARTFALAAARRRGGGAAAPPHGGLAHRNGTRDATVAARQRTNPPAPHPEGAMRELKAHGDTWQVAVDSHAPHPGVRAVVFHCVSNPQRPYRVAEVPETALPSGDALEQLSDREIEGLFERSDPMDYTHDPRAASDHIGEPPRPPRG